MNFTKIKSIIQKEIASSLKRKLSQSNDEADYFEYYAIFLKSYLANRYSGEEVANLAELNTNISDDSRESADIDAAKFIINLMKA